MSDPLAALIAALDQRGPDSNNPWKPEPTRSERRGQRASHRDPVGDRAAGRIDRERKKKEKKQ